MKINACPKCGGRDIRMAGIREGRLFGVTSWDIVCAKCGYKGMPIIFNYKEEYEKFLKELKNEKKSD